MGQGFGGAPDGDFPRQRRELSLCKISQITLCHPRSDVEWRARTPSRGQKSSRFSHLWLAAGPISGRPDRRSSRKATRKDRCRPPAIGGNRNAPNEFFGGDSQHLWFSFPSRMVAGQSPNRLIGTSATSWTNRNLPLGGRRIMARADSGVRPRGPFITHTTSPPSPARNGGSSNRQC